MAKVVDYRQIYISIDKAIQFCSTDVQMNPVCLVHNLVKTVHEYEIYVRTMMTRQNQLNTGENGHTNTITHQIVTAT